MPNAHAEELERAAAGFERNFADAADLAGYSYAAITQHEFGSPEREEVPASVRASPGGYRSFHFWHSGYHGGK